MLKLKIYRFRPVILSLLTYFVWTGSCIDHYQPEQIHISFGNNLSEIVVTWTTYSKTPNSVVEYGINGLVLKATGKSDEFVDGGKQKRSLFIHKVKLPNLTPESTYTYHCGSDMGWSSLFTFHTLPNHADWSPRIALFGDLGSFNAQSLPRLQEETQKNMYDAILHVGDFAYDMDTNEGKVGDEFMRQIQSIAGYVPYMTVPGNHEERYNCCLCGAYPCFNHHNILGILALFTKTCLNMLSMDPKTLSFGCLLLNTLSNFSHYRARFSMPGFSDGLFYSFNMGPIHFIGISTEVYYYINYGFKQMVKQYEWVVNDLKEATSIENRTIRPWIITLGHRPMYCSNEDRDDCTFEEDILRVGIPFLHWFGLEDLFYQYGVDLTIWAHEHSYERTWPLYDGKVCNGSYDAPYTNPKAPVHIVTGSAGCNEYVDHFKKNPKPWSAFRSSDYGYTRLTAYNRTHLYMEQVSDDKEGAIIDWFWLIKNA